MSTGTCTCGCGALVQVTNAEEACGCGCACCTPAAVTREEEIAQLRRLRESVEGRLEELDAG